MFVGIGIGIGRQRFGGGIFSEYASRVVADGGVTEAGSCVDAVSTLLQTASLLLVPSGYKSGKVYAEIPTNGNGDLTWTRASTASRTNSSGNIELMATGVPRLSYMYGSCPALLLEPQRTNLATNSQNFADISWAVLGGSTKGATNLTDPSNNNTACNVTWSAGAGRKYFYGTRTSATGTYTISFYIKSNSGSKFRLYDGVTSSISSDFTATSTYQRYSFTFTQSAGTGGFYGILSASDDSAGDIIVAFAQFEAGAYPTTYIPTTSATATRIADTFTRNNIYTNNLISASGGTWFVELRNNISFTRDTFADGLILKDNTGQNGFVFTFGTSPGTSLVTIRKVVSGVLTALYLTTTPIVKMAIKWNGTTADVFVNGVKVVTATSFTATQLEILSSTGADTTKFIQQMALYSSPLSDTDCTTITTL